MTRFLKAADPGLMRLNLVFLLFVSFLPFTTAVAATHLFASNLSLHDVTISSTSERVAAVLFGLNLTLAALMLYLMLRHAGRTSDVAADDMAEEELAAFAAQRRSAVLLQASAIRSISAGSGPAAKVIPAFATLTRSMRAVGQGRGQGFLRGRGRQTGDGTGRRVGTHREILRRYAGATRALIMTDASKLLVRCG